MIRTAAVALCLALLVGCGDHDARAILVHTHVTPGNELWAGVNGGESVRLLRGAQAYRPVLSPGGDWLAVEVIQMSDLHVVRLFRREGDTWLQARNDVTATAWRSAATHNDIELDQLAHARTQVAGWGRDAHSLSLDLSATIAGADQPFETTVSVPLDPVP